MNSPHPETAMPLTCYPVTMLLLLGAIGCAEDVPAPAVAVTVAGTGMPTFERRTLAIAEEDLPEERYLTFGVAMDGSVIYEASPGHAPVLRRVDSTGALLAAFGRDGEGPGEFRDVFDVRVLGDTLALYDSDRSVLVETTLQGKFLRERRIANFDIKLAWLADSMDHWEPLPNPGQVGKRVIRSPIGEGSGRVVLDTSDRMFAAIITPRPGRPRPLSFPYAATDTRFWIADGWTYRVRNYASNGTLLSDFVHDIPPNQLGPRGFAETRERIMKAPRFMRGANGERIELPDERGRLDTLERERIRHFSRNPLHVDEFGRLWVVGMSRDSTSVDLFADTTFVGRVMLPCYSTGGGPRVEFGRGGWMVLECDVKDGDWPTELQLYRIIERPK